MDLGGSRAKDGVWMCLVPWLCLCISALNIEDDLYNFQHK